MGCQHKKERGVKVTTQEKMLNETRGKCWKESKTFHREKRSKRKMNRL